MRRGDDVGMAEQRVRRRRLFDEDVEGRAGDMAGIERRAQGRLVDQAAARAIDDAHALLGLGEVLGRQDVLGLRRHRRVQGDEVGARQAARRARPSRRRVRRRARPRGTDRRRSTRIFRPRPREATIEPMLPQPMMPSVLPVSSTPMKRFFSHLPAWVEASAAGSWRASANISAIACSAVVIELPNGVFMTITPLRRRGGNVDVVDADAGAADHLQLLGVFEQLGGDLGRRADRQAVVVADDLGELVLVEAGLDVDLDAALLEDRDGGGREFVGDENAGSHGSCSLSSRSPSPAWREKVARSPPDEGELRRVGGRVST